jgi:hypothetical protein
MIGLIDSQWMYAIVPVTVSAKVGAGKTTYAGRPFDRSTEISFGSAQ